MTEGTRLPHPIDLDRDDIDVRDLIKSWRYHGAPLGWDAIVGTSPRSDAAAKSSRFLRAAP